MASPGCPTCGQECTLSMFDRTRALDERRLTVIRDLYNKEEELVSEHKIDMQHLKNDLICVTEFSSSLREQLNVSVLYAKTLREELDTAKTQLDVVKTAMRELTVKHSDTISLLDGSREDVAHLHTQIWNVCVKTADNEKNARIMSRGQL